VLRQNLLLHCISEGMEQMTIEDYPSFLTRRRKLMARKIRSYFKSL
jgi:hypothetical protein